MRNKYIALLLILLLMPISGCGQTRTQTIKIAIMGNPDAFYPCYSDGIEKAVSDLNSEYADSGYSVECKFYSDDGSYEEGSVIIDRLAGDKSITAVIGAVDKDINKTAAYVFDDAGKPFVVPFALYDSVYENNHYRRIFSLSSSARTTSGILCAAAAQTTASRWAVCAADGEFERSEMNGFLKCSGIYGIQPVDCVNISELENNFDEVYSRWETLDVQGVIMFPNGDEGFEILKKLKSRNPSLICGGNSSFDNSADARSDAELKKAMAGFIMSEELLLDTETEENAELLQKMAHDYFEDTGKSFDTWYIQGYNAIRMIGDTAIRNKTVSADDIARILHEDGYSGLLQNYSFSENGSLNTGTKKFIVLKDDLHGTEHTIKN